ncbi:hypothetical protein [Marivirga arenosa]|uniref:Lipoprotein n=1 Tax=Marivirga arenosa TaxID=3059076 RepID=A0AA49GLL9_9BACT|nr:MULTISPECIES: hypothetical protein [unclassified Marivirga]WKK86864.1 hypothetical protein QYS48_08320 [Marivirga sp. ABR2-2]WNB18143.1 hypothetical protein QYS47_29345 [Marivirga sp. BKB1-2]
MKKLLTFVTILMISACGLVEVCVVCTELNTGIEEDYCGSPDQVQEWEDDLEETGNQYGQDWSCVGS